MNDPAIIKTIDIAAAERAMPTDTLRVARAALFGLIDEFTNGRLEDAEINSAIDALIAATPQEQPRRFDRGVLQSLIDDHVSIAHKHSGKMATVWNVCDGCNVFIELLAESAPEVKEPSEKSDRCYGWIGGPEYHDHENGKRYEGNTCREQQRFAESAPESEKPRGLLIDDTDVTERDSMSDGYELDDMTIPPRDNPAPLHIKQQLRRFTDEQRALLKHYAVYTPVRRDREMFIAMLAESAPE